MRNRLILLIVITFIAQTESFACYQASILKPTPFLGNNGEITQLSDGTIWEVKFQYNYLYAYYPEVMVCPEESALIVNGIRINVEQVR